MCMGYSSQWFVFLLQSRTGSGRGRQTTVMTSYLRSHTNDNPALINLSFALVHCDVAPLSA